MKLEGSPLAPPKENVIKLFLDLDSPPLAWNELFRGYFHHIHICSSIQVRDRLLDLRWKQESKMRQLAWITDTNATYGMGEGYMPCGATPIIAGTRKLTWSAIGS